MPSDLIIQLIAVRYDVAELSPQIDLNQSAEVGLLSLVQLFDGIAPSVLAVVKLVKSVAENATCPTAVWISLGDSVNNLPELGVIKSFGISHITRILAVMPENL